MADPGFLGVAVGTVVFKLRMLFFEWSAFTGRQMWTLAIMFLALCVLVAFVHLYYFYRGDPPVPSVRQRPVDRVAAHYHRQSVISHSVRRPSMLVPPSFETSFNEISELRRHSNESIGSNRKQIEARVSSHLSSAISLAAEEIHAVVKPMKPITPIKPIIIISPNTSAGNSSVSVSTRRHWRSVFAPFKSCFAHPKCDD